MNKKKRGRKARIGGGKKIESLRDSSLEEEGEGRNAK